jgi:hypothetical protein
MVAEASAVAEACANAEETIKRPEKQMPAEMINFFIMIIYLVNLYTFNNQNHNA